MFSNSPAGFSRARSLVVLGGGALMLSLSLGMFQSLGLFMGPITRALGITTADFTLAIAVQSIAWGLTGPFAGALGDRFGVRSVMLTGAVAYAGGLVCMAYGGATGLVIGGGVLIGIALASTGSGLALSAAARCTNAAARSKVLGGVAAAGSVGTFVMAPLAQILIGHFGWQLALMGFVGFAAMMVPAAFAAGLADRVALPTGGARGAATASLRTVLGEAANHRGYLTMVMAYFVCGLQLTFLTMHLPTYIANCGLDPMLSAQALALIGLFNVVGTYLFGWLGGRFPKQVLLGLIYILRSIVITTYFLIPATTVSTLLFAATMGMLWLGIIPLVNGLVAQIFGLRYMATLTGVAFLNHQIGSFLGAWGGGLIYDALGSYDRAWQSAVVIGLVAGLAQIFMDDSPTPRLAAVPA